MYKIDRGIPLPPKGGDRASKYPFGSMEVGDSFLVDCSEEDRPKKMGGVYNAWRSYASGRPVCALWKMSLAKVDGGVRCWRVK